MIGSDKAQKVKGAEKSAPVATEKGDAVENLEASGDWWTEALDDTTGVFSVNVRFYVNACYFLVLSISYENCATISSAKNFKISNDQTGLTRSAVFLICSLWCMPSGICTCSRVRRLQRIRLFLCALVMDRIWFPGKHRRRVRAVERCVAHLCWFEANVGPVTVF